MDPKAILDQSRQHASAWVYFNHQRLFELAIQLRVKFKELETYDTALGMGLCDKAGRLLPSPK